MLIYNLIVNSKADVNHSWRDMKPIHTIMKRRFDGVVGIIELFLANGANINDKNSLGSTPLHILVDKKDTWNFPHEDYKPVKTVPMLQLLLRKGALINAQDNAGDTPLHAAIRAQDNESVLVLLNNNCDTSLLNKAEQSPLDMAQSIPNGNSVIVAMLQNPGAFITDANRV